MSTVSVIVPIYNAENYIKACLDSIKNQSYQDFEVILVNDGSHDKSGIICDQYARMDERFTVYHRENAGVSASRNFGLAHSSGKYILFVDADDTIEADMLEGCAQLAEKNEADLVISSFRYYFTDDNNRMMEISLGEERCLSDKELFDQWFSVLASKEILNPPWNKFVRRDLLETNRIRFHEEFSIFEDMIYSVQLLDASKKVVLTNRMYYNYYLKTTGTLVFKFHENYYEALSYFYKTTYEYCCKFENNSSQLQLLNSIYVNLVMMFCKKICTMSPWNQKTRKTKIREIGRSNEFLRVAISTRLNRKKKLICYLLKKQRVHLLAMIYFISAMKCNITRMGSNMVKKRKISSNSI